MLTCSCLCGAVEFTIGAMPDQAINCYCRSCQKSHGAAFTTVLVVLPQYLSFIQGQHLVKRYPVSPTKTGRHICGQCGSKLYAETEAGRPLSVYATTLRDNSVVRVMAHANVADKAPYTVIQDGLPQFDGPLTRDEYMKLVSA